ncbi:MAG TPA: hypothetical protein VI932_09455, partial [Bacteroidota bacterium]|nr:hypothetical protein [Bacteroidota bacterium]
MTITKSVFPQTAIYRTVRGEITPATVHAPIGKHMLVDDLGFVVDLKRSSGPYIYDSLTNRKLLDFFSFVASMPIGMNHPKLNDAKFLERLTA